MIYFIDGLLVKPAGVMVRAQASVLGTFQMQRRRIGDLHCMAGQEQPAGQRHARTIILSRFRGAPGDRRGDTRCRVAAADTIMLSLFLRAVSRGR